jgi:hypothetical protein
VAIADLGLVVRRTRLAGLRASRKGPRVTVRGRLVPAGGALRIELRDLSGKARAAARSGRSGRFVLAAATEETDLRVVTPGDRTRLPGSFEVQVPPPKGG